MTCSTGTVDQMSLSGKVIRTFRVERFCEGHVICQVDEF